MTTEYGSGREIVTRLRGNEAAMFSLYWLCLVAAACVVGPYLMSHDYHTQNLTMGACRPSLEHWLGTDTLGRDLLARLLYGGRISLAVGLAATGVALVIGLVYGSVSGYRGGAPDRVMMRIVDVVYPLPFTLLVILLMAFCGRNIVLLFLAIGCVKWLNIARIVRTQTLLLKERAFVSCARSLGQNAIGIWIKHLLPNLWGTVIVYTTLTIPNIILEESFLSFLGLGVQPPLSSWGALIFDGAKQMESYPWLLLFPCLIFSLTLFSLNFLGDGLRDAFDPTGGRG
jgi:oligopeptide transport system permease protein